MKVYEYAPPHDMVTTTTLTNKAQTEQQDYDKDSCERAADPMAELDQGFDPCQIREDGSVALRPVTAASRARSRCPHHCSPCDHQNIECRDKPGICV